MTANRPVDRASDNVTGIVSVLVTGVWMGAMVTGQDWWLAALLVGYVAVVPITAMLFGDSHPMSARDDRAVTAARTDPEPQTESPDETDPLATLRARYARGELTDEQFERKVERLLENETLEDVEDRLEARTQAGSDVEDRGETGTDRPRDVERAD